MKKILAVFLGILILATVLYGCDKEIKADLHGVYGTFERSENYELTKNGEKVFSNHYSTEVNNFINNTLKKIGKTITINEAEVLFRGGDIEPDFSYRFNFGGYIFFFNNLDDFPLDHLRYNHALNKNNQIKYHQLILDYSFDLHEINYCITLNYYRI